MNSSLLSRALRFLSVNCALLALAACGGSGGDDPPPPSAGDVTISGRITFDRVPFHPTLDDGLNVANPIESAAREVIVEIIDAGTGTLLASTSTNASGDYSVTAPANRNVRVRAKAQMQRTGAAPNWNIRVLNNTNGDALYALDSEAFSSGTANVTRNLRAATGWNGTTYVNGERAAAPFAILDTIYQAKELVLSADAGAVFANLDLFWSPSNRATVNVFCPDTGDIGTTFYQVAGTFDECATSAELPAGIYILGDFASGGGDTDEFDQHIIAHEFGHYFEDRFSRSDSLGGSHTGTDRMDLRVAFGEGWGNAYSGMVLQDPEYRDSHSGVDRDFGFNMETDNQTSIAGAEGWYSETSISEILWDIYDAAADPNDNVALGFGPIYQTMIGPQVTTDALTSIFSFADGIREANPAQAAAIAALLASENIFVTDEFGTDETNDGGDPSVLPMYSDLAGNTPVPVCVRATAGAADNNKLGNRKFFRFVNNAARLVSIQATGAVGDQGTVAATDPDIFVFRSGAIVAAGITDGAPSETLDQIALGSGTHIIEVYDFDLQLNPLTTRCMTLSITGN